MVVDGVYVDATDGTTTLGLEATGTDCYVDVEFTLGAILLVTILLGTSLLAMLGIN